MKAMVLGKGKGVFQGGLEIVAVFHQFGAKGHHGGILFRIVAVRDDDRCGEADAGRGKGDALPMIAPGRGDDPGNVGVGTAQGVHIDQAAREP